MLVSFDQLPAYARIWVYASPLSFSEQQKTDITRILSGFLSHWEAHGAPLKAAFIIEMEHFIIIGVDESFNAASGCSIDKSVHAIKEVEAGTGLSLFDRLTVYAVSPQNNLVIIPPVQIKQAIKTGLLTPETNIVQTAVQSMEEYRQKWMVEAKSTYLHRYFAPILG